MGTTTIPLERSVVQSRRSRAQRYLLVTGLLSSILYVLTDLIGGLRYPGYSFIAHAISELMAEGAPSERFVDPLFVLYSLLAAVFGFAVFREAGRRLAPQLVGASLVLYGLLGATGPIFFEMQQRGSGSLKTDAAHVLLTGALSLLLIISIGLGSSLAGKRFRTYSLATGLTVVIFGSLTAPFAAKLAAGQPTPGFGIIERVTIYAALLWIATLSVALARRYRQRNARVP